MIRNDELFEPLNDEEQKKYIKFSSFNNIVNTYIPDGFPLLITANKKNLVIHQILSDNFINNYIEQICEIKNIEKDIVKKILFLYKFNIEKITATTYEIKDLIELTNDMSLYEYDYNLFLERNEIELFKININTIFNQALCDLLNNKTLASNFKITLEYSSSPENGTTIIEFTVYVLISYFNKLKIEHNTPLPQIMYKYLIINHLNNNIPVVALNKTNFISTIQLNHKLKRNLYEYQKYNIKWMLNHEKNIQNRLLIKSYISDDNYYTYQYTNNNKTDINENNYLICRKTNYVVNPNTLDNITIQIKGGILADEVGLGKTFSFIGLIAETLESEKDNPTVVFCPIRLCKQWQEEINVSSELEVCVISTIIQYRKFVKDITKKNIHFDIVIVSYNFIFNENYKKYKTLDTSDTNNFIENIKWKRVILDEGHEIFSQGMNNISKLVAEGTRDYLTTNFNNCYKWICSATPCSTIEERNNLFEFLCDFDKNLFNYSENRYNSINHIFQNIFDMCSSKNTKESVQQFVTIPTPLITTEFIKQTDIERSIYESALGDIEKMIQLCSHVVVSDEYSNILGNKPLPLDKIQEKMTTHYKNAIDKIKKTIGNYNNDIDKNKKNIINKEKQIETLGKQIKTLKKQIQKMKSTNNNSNNNTNNNIDDDNDIGTIQEKENKIQDKENNIYELKKIIVSLNISISETENRVTECNDNLNQHESKFKIFSELGKRLKENNECIICFTNLEETTKAILNCGHFFCTGCVSKVLKNTDNNNCPYCRTPFNKNNLKIITPDVETNKQVNKWGSKMYNLITHLNKTLDENVNNRIIIFSQWDSLLKLVGNVLSEYDIEHIFLMGSIHVINSRIEKFKKDPNIRIVLISSDREVSGLTLTEASHIILLDTLNTDKKKSVAIETQAIGRSVRIGQTKKVQVKRLIMEDTIEHVFYKNNIEGQNINISKYIHENM